MLEANFPNYENTGVHSTSNSARLASAFPNSPIHSGKGTHIENFTREGIKDFYEENHLDGAYPENSDFTEGSYDYDTAPSIPSDVAPENEEAPGKSGSTVVASGKGPQTATLNLKELGPSSPHADPSSRSLPPGSGPGSDADPKSSASKISEQGLRVNLILGDSGFK